MLDNKLYVSRLILNFLFIYIPKSITKIGSKTYKTRLHSS
jgi:hypothetical protein